MTMKIYSVEITETRRKAVSVRAKDKDDALQRALDAWKNSEIILDDFNDFTGTEAKLLDEGKPDDGSIIIDPESVLGGYGSED